MTVGVMVGGHGREWAACLAPAHTGTTADHSDSCTQTSTGTTPVVNPASALQVLAGADLPRAVSTLGYAARDLSLTLTQDKFRQQRQGQAASVVKLQVSPRVTVSLKLVEMFVLQLKGFRCCDGVIAIFIYIT